DKAKAVLKLIEKSQQLTYDILETSINADPTKKPIPSSTLRSWVEKSGGKFRKGEVCPLHVAAGVWQIASDRRTQAKSAAA
ncbi:MAG: hypothetical protein ACRC62_34895, partial [Microcoleus sp.]